jgi:hypothetical protein
MRTTLLKTAAALAVAAPVLALAACGSQHAAVTPAAPAAATQQDTPTPGITVPIPTPPAAPKTFGLAIGATVTMTDDTTGATWDVTLNSVRPFTQGQYDDPPPAGQHYIVINVTYAATTGPVDVNEWDWTAKDPTGLVSDVQYMSSPNDLSATTIQSGSKIRGTVVLAARNGSGGTVVYSPGSSEQASWEFTAAQA